jgi:hypothetical protein
LGRCERLWIDPFRPAAAFVNVDKAKGLVDGNEYGHQQSLAGSLPSRDFVLKSAA